MSGCTSPLASRARASSVWWPSWDGVHGNSHNRQPNSVALLVRFAGFQLRPWSTLTLTDVTGPESPVHAAPRTTVRFPISRAVPLFGNEMTLFTRRLVTGRIISGGTTLPGATGFSG